MSLPNTDPRRLPAWLREPLLHFVVLGALLFALDRITNEGVDDPHVIVVGANVDEEALRVFREARGRDPNADELYALRRIWLDNEVLYREGIALELDRGDKAIRDRVIFKALSMVNAGLQKPPIDDAALRAWFEKNRAKYDEPPRVDFHEAVIAGDSSEASARAFAAALNAGTPGDVPGDVQAGLRVFKGRPLPSLAQSYGDEFGQALAAAPAGTWTAMPTRDGWRVMRLDTLSPARAAEFEPMRGVVLADWTDAVMAEQRSAAVQALAMKYTVRTAAGTP